MTKQLVIVESPAKAKTIKNYLGADYNVLSTYGHVRDLPKKQLAIDTENDFTPRYITPQRQKETVRSLQKAAQGADTVWLATDEDREGEAIAWHLVEALQLPPERTRRIAFHEITPEAIAHAMDNPRDINQQLVDAQQARRVLDRLVGYKLSPLLWRKVRPGLSAGRVQSVAVRLIVEREREISNFTPASEFKVTAEFQTESGESFTAESETRPESAETVRSILQGSIDGAFSVSAVEQKPSYRNPAAPFTTSTLQQTAARKLGLSVRQTMNLAQQLYEAGYITYMRTDSVELSESARTQAADVIKQNYGNEYLQHRSYRSRSDAQEAHEAIRPTDMARQEAGDDHNQQQLYKLIHGRTLASQMQAAQLEKTHATISATGVDMPFLASGEVITFDGWLAAYQDRKITDTVLPDLSEGQSLKLATASGEQTFKRPPARYGEASLVRKLESMGIGRPSTYAPTITTIQDRGYVEKADVEGEEKSAQRLYLSDQQVHEDTVTVTYGQDRNKLLPTQIAYLVNDFLMKHFPDIIDYDFTKAVEEEFDRIAQDGTDWRGIIREFYTPFTAKLQEGESVSKEEASGARELGTHPETKRPILARMGRYGPMLQMGHAEDEEKPSFAPIPPEKDLDTVTFEDALDMFRLPRTVGHDTDGTEITANYGRYGPYVRADSLYAPIPEGYTPLTVTEAVAQEALEGRRQRNAQRTIADLGDIKVLNGRYGPYVTDGTKNARVPEDHNAEDIDKETAQQLLSQAKPRRKRRQRSARRS